MVMAGSPVSASDINAIIAATTGKPLCRLIAQSSQVLADATDVVITFGAASEDIDTHGMHDTAVNTGRVTPTVAGYYSLSGVVYFTGRTDFSSLSSSFRKNGATVATSHRQGPNAAGQVRSVAVGPILVSANGSTDYFELVANQDNTGNTNGSTNVSGAATSIFEVRFERPL